MFQPVLHNWCNKGRGMVDIKDRLLLIGKSASSGSKVTPRARALPKMLRDIYEASPAFHLRNISLPSPNGVSVSTTVAI